MWLGSLLFSPLLLPPLPCQWEAVAYYHYTLHSRGSRGRVLRDPHESPVVTSAVSSPSLSSGLT